MKFNRLKKKRRRKRENKRDERERDDWKEWRKDLRVVATIIERYRLIGRRCTGVQRKLIFPVINNAGGNRVSAAQTSRINNTSRMFSRRPDNRSFISITGRDYRPTFHPLLIFADFSAFHGFPSPLRRNVVSYVQLNQSILMKIILPPVKKKLLFIRRAWKLQGLIYFFLGRYCDVFLFFDRFIYRRLEIFIVLRVMESVKSNCWFVFSVLHNFFCIRVIFWNNNEFEGRERLLHCVCWKYITLQGSFTLCRFDKKKEKKTFEKPLTRATLKIEEKLWEKWGLETFMFPLVDQRK